MIISHRHKFIFVKNFKTAGSSIELALMTCLGPRDVFTPMEEIRDFAETYPHLSVKNRIRKGLLGNPIILKSHSPLTDALDAFGKKVLDYTVFTVERNPWDRAVSGFFWWNKEARALPGEEQIALFRKSVANGRFVSNNDRYSIDGNCAADVVIPFEDLSAGFRTLCQDLELPDAVDLEAQSAKSGLRPTKALSYPAFYDADARRTVEVVAAREIALMGYSFNDPETGRFSPVSSALSARQRFINQKLWRLKRRS